MNTGSLTARCFEDADRILRIDNTVQRLLVSALRRQTMKITVRNDSDGALSEAEGEYRGCTWCLTDRGLACVLRFTETDHEFDSAIDVSRIEDIELI